MIAIGGDPGSNSRDHAVNKDTDLEDSCDIQEIVAVFSALNVVTQEDVSAWAECDSDFTHLSDEAIL